MTHHESETSYTSGKKNVQLDSTNQILVTKQWNIEKNYFRWDNEIRWDEEKLCILRNYSQENMGWFFPKIFSKTQIRSAQIQYWNNRGCEELITYAMRKFAKNSYITEV